MNQMFLRFTPPCFGLSKTERRILRFAIEGEPDQRIAELLLISPATLKKRWAQIYEVTNAALRIQVEESNGRRGVEVRRHVLQYIRQHPEELHAYAARKVTSDGADSSRTSSAGERRQVSAAIRR